MIRYILGLFADILIFINKIVGFLYLKSFGFIGTSWFDHRFDYLRGPGNFHWLERAFLALDRMKPGSQVLDIGCGDGIFSGIFYSSKAKNVLAVDKDRKAIEHAKRYYKKDCVKYAVKDINRWKIVPDKFDLVLMFAVIEHLRNKDGLKVLRNIGKSLVEGGLFFGSTPILTNVKKKSNFEHENEFRSVESLRKFLKTAFAQVKTFETHWPGREECYFECRRPL
jgi:2-polyprenyl-3-methyl-5-hydroxy-6-metoxy-1,4-benzoquinol methylase